MRRLALALGLSLLCATVRADEDESPLVWLRRIRAPVDVGAFGWVGGSSPRDVVVHVATRSDPIGWRSHLAFAQLASRLGVDHVPHTELRRLGLGDLLAAGRGDPFTHGWLDAEALALGDGRVRAVVVDRPAGRRVDWPDGPDAASARGWARGGDGDEVRGVAWVETVVLDYLAGAVRRHDALIAADGHVWLADNRGAMHERPEPRSLDRLLSRVQEVRRFPTKLVEGLQSYDHDAALAQGRRGAAVDWCVGEREISDVDDRRRTVLSLVAARVAERGQGEVVAPWGEARVPPGSESR